MSITSGKYHPPSKQELHRPRAPSVTAIAVPAPSGRELWGANLSTLACCYGEVPAVNPSVTASPCQLPLAREPRAVPADNAHGNLLRIVTSLTRPVSLPSRMGSENTGTLHVLTAAARRSFGKGAFGVRAKKGLLQMLCNRPKPFTVVTPRPGKCTACGTFRSARRTWRFPSARRPSGR